MPCNSDHMNPTPFELELSRVLCLLHEAQTSIPVDPHSTSWRGYHPDAYGHATKQSLDTATATLCSLLRTTSTPLSSFSLELQLWWREHQKKDQIRKARETAAAHQATLRSQALAKLTPQERSALGF